MPLLEDLLANGPQQQPTPEAQDDLCGKKLTLPEGACGLEKGHAGACKPELFYFRVLFRNGLMECGFSALTTREFTKKVLEGTERVVRWYDDGSKDGGDGFVREETLPDGTKQQVAISVKRINATEGAT